MTPYTTSARIADVVAPAALMRNLWLWCLTCQARSRQRHFLAQLDDHGLRDIGLSRCDAMVELDKPFWRA
jgi:uncharacterized protein YjiS (DUF1127 family)